MKDIILWPLWAIWFVVSNIWAFLSDGDRE